MTEPELVLAKLSEVLFVETLRRYINTLPPDQIGWLAGARDPFIGQALALMHKEPAHPWTVEELARRVDFHVRGLRNASTIFWASRRWPTLRDGG